MLNADPRNGLNELGHTSEMLHEENPVGANRSLKVCGPTVGNTKRGHDDVDLTPYLLKSPPDGSWQ